MNDNERSLKNYEITQNYNILRIPCFTNTMGNQRMKMKGA